MTVGLKVDFLWFPIGTGDFFNSFFSTICMRLEDSKWGSRFPVIMNDLYNGSLSKEKLNLAQKELVKIQFELSKLPPNKVVWDADDLRKSPPWGNDISKDIIDLAEYFITNQGNNLIDVLSEAISEATDEDLELEVKSL